MKSYKLGDMTFHKIDDGKPRLWLVEVYPQGRKGPRKRFATEGAALAGEIYTQGRVSTDSDRGIFSAHLFECRYKRFRQLFSPFRFGEVWEMGAPKGTGAHGVYGAVELRHDVPFHDVGQFVPALMIGKCLF